MRYIFTVATSLVLVLGFFEDAYASCGYKSDGQYHCGENCGYKSDGQYHCE